MSQEVTVWSKRGVGSITKFTGCAGYLWDCWGPDGYYVKTCYSFEEALDHFGELDDLRLGPVS